MKTLVLTLENEKEWNQLIAELPIDQQDIYFTYGYYFLYEYNKEGEANCFIYKENENSILYPFLKNEINSLGYQLDDLYYDIQGAYGYNGIITSSIEPNFISNFKKAFGNYCQENHIVAEFIRLHPLIVNMPIFEHDYELLKDRETVVINLEDDYLAIWEKKYSSENRNMIRKAQKLGYRIKIITNPTAEEIDSFIEIYIDNMQKMNVNKYYYFNKEYFENTFRKLSNNAYIFNVINENQETVGSSIFFKYGQYFHYHLSGKSNLSDNCATNFMIDKAVIYAKEIGAKLFHLGGGRSSLENDSLLKFKKNFSKNTVPFYIAKRIHNQTIYDEIVSQWGQMYSESNKTSNNLLRYRKVAYQNKESIKNSKH